MFYLPTGPKATRLSDHGLKLLKPGAKLSLSSFKLFISGIFSQGQKADWHKGFREPLFVGCTDPTFLNLDWVLINGHFFTVPKSVYNCHACSQSYLSRFIQINYENEKELPSLWKSNCQLWKACWKQTSCEQHNWTECTWADKIQRKQSSENPLECHTSECFAPALRVLGLSKDYSSGILEDAEMICVRKTPWDPHLGLQPKNRLWPNAKRLVNKCSCMCFKVK
jgi:hypothetical protein